jgi:hypothetical protein
LSQYIFQKYRAQTTTCFDITRDPIDNPESPVRLFVDCGGKKA